MDCVLCKRQGIKTTTNGKFCDKHLSEMKKDKKDTLGKLVQLLAFKGIITSKEQELLEGSDKK